MMHERFLIGGLTGLVILLSGPVAAQPSTAPTIRFVPSAAALLAYGQGQAHERLLQDHLQPGTCGIVLERSRCRADFEAIKALRGEDEFDGAMEAWLATGELAAAVKGYNGTYVPDAAWIQTPEFAWWYTVGMIAIATSLPQEPATTAYLLRVPEALAEHPDATPAAFRNLVASTGSPFARLKPLQAAVFAAVPVSAFPEPAFAQGIQGDAQLGIYVSTLQQLVDNPFALSRPESRQFGLAVVRRLQEIDDRYAAGIEFDGITRALEGEIPAEPRALDAAFRQPIATALSMKWPLERRQALRLGTLIAQVAYNAAVLRDPSADTAFRYQLSSLPAYAGMTAAVHSDITSLQNIPYTDKGGKWSDVNAAASRAVIDITAI